MTFMYSNWNEMEKNYPNKKKKSSKSFILQYDNQLQAMVLTILDTGGMYPCYWRDPEAGLYKITKTENEKVIMSK